VNVTNDDSDGLFTEFFDLWTADTADDLHRVLALHQPIRSSSDWTEPYQLLARHNKSEPHTSTVTATLLLTDSRWRKGVGQLVRHIAESGMIDAADLDMVAITFVTADDHVYWEIPESWFGDESLVIHIEHDAIDPQEGVDEAPGEEMVVAARRVHAPLRRWAAARLVARDPTAWEELFVSALDRRGADGAAILSGLLDASDHLRGPTRRIVIDTGTDWPRAGVRKHALERLAELGDRHTAHTLALADASAQIRRWAPALLETETAAADEPVDPNVETVTPRAQDSLF
jgi:hypothetical protein